MEKGTQKYRIEYEPRLIEEAVLCAIAGHPQERVFREKRDRIYELGEDEERDQAFNALHERWFHLLELDLPLRTVFELWPILEAATHRCILTKARAKKGIGAELYCVPTAADLSERERRTILLQLTPELICRREKFVDFLHHEMLHIADMLDPEFGYEPELPKSSAGPANDHFLQQRYTILWDITVDGRLARKGWVSGSKRVTHLQTFKNAFPGAEPEQEKLFFHFFDQDSHTHRELVAFAQHPEKWLSRNNGTSSFSAPCSLCHFPTAQLMDPASISTELSAHIRQDNPGWQSSVPICRQCYDLYAARSV